VRFLSRKGFRGDSVPLTHPPFIDPSSCFSLVVLQLRAQPNVGPHSHKLPSALTVFKGLVVFVSFESGKYLEIHDVVRLVQAFLAVQPLLSHFFPPLEKDSFSTCSSV